MKTKKYVEFTGHSKTNSVLLNSVPYNIKKIWKKTTNRNGHVNKAADLFEAFSWIITSLNFIHPTSDSTPQATAEVFYATENMWSVWKEIYELRVSNLKKKFIQRARIKNHFREFVKSKAKKLLILTTTKAKYLRLVFFHLHFLNWLIRSDHSIVRFNFRFFFRFQ